MFVLVGVALRSRVLTIALLVALGGLCLFLLSLAGRAARDLRDRTLALGDSEKRFRSLVQNSSDVIFIVGAAGEISYCSPSVNAVFGLDAERVLGRPFTTLVHPEDDGALASLLELAKRNPAVSHAIECRWMHQDGEWRLGESTVTGRIDDASIRGIVVNTRDVTPRRHVEQQLMQQAFHDPLTGLPNRVLFGDRLQQALERGRRAGQPATVIFVDLDDFKNVNDSLGHEAGDELIRTASARIAGVVRLSDTAARMGGDEFALLVEGASLDDSIAVVQRLLAEVAQPFTIAGREVSITASAGISLADDVETTAADMLRNADLALYSAKAEGKAGFAVYHAEMHHVTLQRLEIRAGLDEALAHHQFVLHYQPVLDLRSGEITGLEALVRWNHPERGLIPPNLFIPVAEDSGAIIPIGRWVLEQACRDAQQLRGDHAAAAGLVMGVNLSMRQLRYRGVVQDVSKALTASGLPPACLVLEVTESLVMNEPEEVIGRLRELKQLGLRIAVDDFGTGYSSLSYLQHLPIDILKVDRSFVSGMDGERQNWALCGAVVKIAESLNLDTIAEGIETAEQRLQLTMLGCDSGQGFLFHRPQALGDVRQLFLAERADEGSAA